MTQFHADRESAPPPSAKTTLYCPSCGHTAAIGGDWRVTNEEGERVLRCPECEAVVDRRPNRERHALTA